MLIEARVIEPGVTVNTATLRVLGRRFSSERPGSGGLLALRPGVPQSGPCSHGVKRPREGAVGDTPVEPGLDLSALQLDVYQSRDGWWHPEHGDVLPPEGWEFLPTGQAFVTRTVKVAGVFWLAWAPRSRTRQHRRLLGLWAPEATIQSAEQAAADTATARALRREAGARSRQRQEARYQDELTKAIVAYLAFAPTYQTLAQTIARQAAERAALVGSGRVGRTRLLPLQERAALAARAQIRHAHTDYHHQLDELALVGNDDELYRAIKADAQDAVDDFLLAHRADET